MRDEEDPVRACPPTCTGVLCSEVLISPSNSKRRLYIGLKAIHINGAMFFDLLQVPRGNRRLLPLWMRPDALLQLHQPGHVGRDELVFDPRRRGPVVAVVVVTVHLRRGGQHGFGLTDQRHLGADKVTGREAGSGRKKWKCVRKGIDATFWKELDSDLDRILYPFPHNVFFCIILWRCCI